MQLNALQALTPTTGKFHVNFTPHPTHVNGAVCARFALPKP